MRPEWGGSLPLRSWQSRGETINRLFIHPSTHPNTHPSIQKMLAACLLCAACYSNCLRHWDERIRPLISLWSSCGSRGTNPKTQLSQPEL